MTVPPFKPSLRPLDAFITPAQQKGLSAGRKTLDRANDDALQEALRASLSDDGNGLTAAQIFARETGDPDTMRQANDDALARGIQASLEPDNAAPKAARNLVPDDELNAQRTLIDKLRDWLSSHGFDIRSNKGNGNNCLIIAMLQHASGDYHSEHAAQARHYRKLLAERSGGEEKTSNALFSDDELTRWLVAQINRDFFGSRHELYLKFRFVTADLDGKPAVRTTGEGSRVAGIVDMAGHYEAFTARTPG